MVDFFLSLVAYLPFEWSQYSFMQRALLAVLILGPLFAIPGCLVINNQMAFFSDAIGHSALTGIALGVVLGLHDPFWAMLIFAALLAFGLSLLRRFGSGSTDTFIGVIMSGAIALGIVLLSRNGGFNRYSRFLIGDVLSVNSSDLLVMGSGLVLLIILWIFYANRFFLISFNRSLAMSRGYNVWLRETLLSVLVAVTVTASVQWIGVLVINAFLILPAAAARNVSHSVRSYTLYSVSFALIAGVSGLLFSYYNSTATGATIVLVSIIIFGATLLHKFAFAKRIR